MTPSLPSPKFKEFGGGVPKGRRGRGLDRRAAFWFLYIPPLFWLSLFFLIPLFLMFLYSFRADMRGSIFASWQPALDQYIKLSSTASYWRLLGVSVLTAFFIAFVSVALSYPVAYFLAFHARERFGFYLVLLLVPFWTSYLLRVMAWKIMLGTEGVINSFLIYLDVIREPLTSLLYNRSAVIVTLIYVWIPFATLPILAALQRIDISLFEAAADLGARPLRQFLRITLPLSLPGVFASFFMVFIPTVGEYVTPLLVGGSSGMLYGNIIQDFFTKAANWPFGSAMSMVMLAGTLVFVFFATRIVNLKDLLE